MALLVAGGRGERRDAVVAGVERLDQALERTTLAAGVTPLEEHEQPRAELARAELPAEVEAELEEAPLRGAERGSRTPIGPAAG